MTITARGKTSRIKKTSDRQRVIKFRDRNETAVANIKKTDVYSVQRAQCPCCKMLVNSTDRHVC